MVKWYSAVFCTLNAIFIILGLLLVTVGAVALASETLFEDLLEGQVTSPAVAIIAVGALTSLTACIGCCGLFTKSSWMMKRYAIALLALMIIKVMIGLVASLFENTFQVGFEHKLTVDFKRYHEDPEARDIVDRNQQAFRCCGVSRPSDWFWSNGTKWIPKSCCHDPSSVILLCGYKYFGEGCAEKISFYINQWLHFLACTSIAIAMIEMFGMAFGLCLARKVRKDKAKLQEEYDLDENEEFI